MYFIPQNSRWYSYIIHHRPSIWYSMTSIFLGVSIALWYYLIFSPGEQNLHLLNTQLKTKHAELNTLTKTASQLSTQQEIDTLKHTINLYKTDNPKKQLTQLGTHIISAVETSGLQLISYELVGTKPMQWYQRSEVSISARGSMHAFDTFFSYIASQNLCIYCPNFTITKEPTAYTFQGILRSCIII